MLFKTHLAVLSIVALAVLANGIPTDSVGGTWSQGRASYYPAPHQPGETEYTPQNLNTLTCVTRSNSPNPLPPTVDVSFPAGNAAGAFAAISDHSPIWSAPECQENTDPSLDPTCFQQSTCGACFEIQCVSYWNNSRNDHPNTCKQGKSVVVKILDACPGRHRINLAKGPENLCIDRGVNHFDLYRPAFDHIANRADGLIQMSFRPTSCDRLGYWSLNNGVSERATSLPFTPDLPTSP